MPSNQINRSVSPFPLPFGERAESPFSPLFLHQFVCEYDLLFSFFVKSRLNGSFVQQGT